LLGAWTPLLSSQDGGALLGLSVAAVKDVLRARPFIHHYSGTYVPFVSLFTGNIGERWDVTRSWTGAVLKHGKDGRGGALMYSPGLDRELAGKVDAIANEARAAHGALITRPSDVTVHSLDRRSWPARHPVLAGFAALGLGTGIAYAVGRKGKRS
jgi:hypothetical protein